MAGDDKQSLPSESKVLCKYCKKSVSSTVARCVTCEGAFHTSCALRIPGLTAVGKDNLVKCCSRSRRESEVIGNQFVSLDIYKEMMTTKEELLRSKDQIITELKEKEKIFQKAIDLLEAKIRTGVANVSQPSQINVSKNPLSVTASSVTPSTSSDATISKNRRNIISKEATTLSKQSQSSYSSRAKSGHVNGSNNNQSVTLSQVNTAVLSAQTANKMRYIQDLTKEEIEEGWEKPKQRRNRRYVVGGNNNRNVDIQTVPKYVSFHVTRLGPATKPEDLERFIQEKFPEARCEEHQSKRPDLYKSMKVSVMQKHAREAWKRDAWPPGAVVSRFFAQHKMSSRKQEVADLLSQNESSQ